MNILMYKFRPILLSGIALGLDCVELAWLPWYSCSSSTTIVNGKFWITTTLETVPDKLEIGEFITHDNIYGDLWETVYEEISTLVLTDDTTWYEPQQIFKTFGNVTVGVWMYWHKDDEVPKLCIRVFHDKELVYSDDSVVTSNNECYLTNSFIHFSETGVINLFVAYEDVDTDHVYYYNHQSTDGGLTWTDYPIDDFIDANLAAYYSSITGYSNKMFASMQDNYDALYKSTDYGHTWSLVTNDFFPDDMHDQACNSKLLMFKGDLYKLTLYYSGGYNLGFRKSTNDGVDWTFYPFPNFWTPSYPLTTDAVVDGDYIHVVTMVNGTIYYLRSTDGETFEIVSSYLDEYIDSYDQPLVLAVDGDLISVNTYYLSRKVIHEHRAIIVSEDGGQSWRMLESPYTEGLFPEGFVRLTWTNGDAQMDIYRRINLPYYVSDWSLVDTGEGGIYLDFTSWCNVPYEYYLQVAGGDPPGEGLAPTGSQYLHGNDLYLKYPYIQAIPYSGDIYVTTWLKYAGTEEGLSTIPGLALPHMALVLKNLEEYEKIVMDDIPSTVLSYYKAIPCFEINPFVFAVVCNTNLCYVFWFIDGEWISSSLPLRTGYSFYSTYSVYILSARANGEAIVVLATSLTSAKGYIDVFRTTDFGQTWAGPTTAWEIFSYVSYPDANIWKSDSAYYILAGKNNHATTRLIKSADGITWKSVGQVNQYAALTIDCNDNETAYFIYTTVTYWKTYLYKEAGIGNAMSLIWEEKPCYSIAVSPTYASDSTIFVGTYYGVYKSTDGGDSFSVTALTTGTFEWVAISPDYENDLTAFAILSGTIGVYKTTNGGTSWTLYSSGLTTNLNRIVLSPDFASDNTIYGICGVYDKHCYKSTDGGETWTLKDNGIPTSRWMYCIDISPNYASDLTVFIAGAVSPGPGVWKTTDAAENWTLKISGMTGSGYIKAIALSPNFASDQILFAAQDYVGLYKSTDGGDSWTLTSMASATLQILDIAISPDYDTDSTLYVITVHDVFCSTDGGTTWSSVGKYLGAYFWGLDIQTGSPLFGCSIQAPAAGVYKMDTNGTLLEFIKAFETAPLYQVFQIYANGNHICFSAWDRTNSKYVIMYSSDGGANFSQVSVLPDLTLSVYGRFYSEGSRVILSGKNFFTATGQKPAYAISEDYGATWAIVEMEYSKIDETDEKLIDLLIISNTD